MIETTTERYPAGFSTNAHDVIREAISFGALPDMTVKELDDAMFAMTPYWRGIHLQQIADRLWA